MIHDLPIGSIVLTENGTVTRVTERDGCEGCAGCLITSIGEGSRVLFATKCGGGRKDGKYVAFIPEDIKISVDMRGMNRGK